MWVSPSRAAFGKVGSIMKRLRVRLITTRMVWGITEVRRALERNIAVLTLRAISGNYARPFTHLVSAAATARADLDEERAP